MGNTEGSHSHGRSKSQPASATNSPYHQTKPQKVKSPGKGSSQTLKKPGSTQYHDVSNYYTCKADLASENENANVPAYYFTASQLPKPQQRSREAEDARKATSDQTAADRRIAWPTRRSKTEADTDDIDSAYLTASMDFPATWAPAISTLTGVNLKERLNKFNTNSHGLQMSLDIRSGVVEGFIRVHMHLVSPVTMRVSSDDMPSFVDGFSPQSNADSDGNVITFSLPPDTTKHIHISSKDSTKDVIHHLLTKFSITDSPSQFILYEKDTVSLALRKLRTDDRPLLLSLAWSEDHDDGLGRKQFVLKEKTYDVVKWDAFSLPELNNFLAFLNNEEQQQIGNIRHRFLELRQHLRLRANELAPATAAAAAPVQLSFSESGTTMLY